MKVLTVISTFNNNYGGVQKTAQIIVNKFHEKNHDSKILITTSNPLNKNEDLLKNIFEHITVFDYSDTKNIINWSPNLIIFIDHSIDFQKIEKLFNLKEAFKICFSIWGLPSKISENSNQLLLLSKWSQLLYKNNGGKNKKISMIGIPFDIKEISQYNTFIVQNILHKNISSQDKIITLGRIGQPAEGSWSPIIIDIFEEVHSSYPNVKLLLVGASKNTVKRANESKLKSKIILLETIQDRSEIFKIHSSIDIFIHISSFGETFGKVILEALYSGSFVLVLNTPWASIGHKFYNFTDNSLIHVNNIKNIKKILLLLIKKINSKNYKRNFKIKYIEPYSGENTIKKILSLYEDRNLSQSTISINRFDMIKSLDFSFDKLNTLSRLHIILFGLKFKYMHRFYCKFKKLNFFRNNIINKKRVFKNNIN